MDLTRIVFSGSGGQGVVTASVILAEAAVIYSGLSAVQTQAYGPEARGGATRADVIISESPIHFPKVLNPHILICLTQEAYNKFAPIIRPGGLLLVDPQFVKIERKVEARQRELEMFKAVMEEIGNSIVHNICMLGVLIGFTDLVAVDSIRSVIEDRVPPDFKQMNRKALNVGLKLSEHYKQQ
ncbi:2-oxoacid:acceptor oxidoreductase family protein [Thermodesulfobacteriota bacterium]